MEAKKISFGFSKTTQQSKLLKNKAPAKEETKVELIKCLEGKEIKLLEEKKEPDLLVIPLKENHKTSAALASLIKRRVVLNNEEEPEATKPVVAKQTSMDVNLGEGLESRAARELLSEVSSHNLDCVKNNLVLPVVKPEDLPLDGAKEPTFDDYESVPVEQFGRAMLRGMGWVEISDKNEGLAALDGPISRPKGMGLGADKVLKPKALLVQPERNELLGIRKQAYVRILGGQHKDMYGQIEGFDDFAGRVIVKMAIGGAMEVFNEFLCQPVAKNEYLQYAKCINTAKYEAYKKQENEHGQIILPKEHKYENSEEFRTKADVKEFNIKKEKKECAYERKERDNNCSESSTHKNYQFDTKKKYEVTKNDSEKETRCPISSKHRQSPSSYLHNDLSLPSSSHRERKYSTDDSGDSSDSDADSHRRRLKKNLSKSSSNRRSKKSKSKRRDYKYASNDDSDEETRRHKSHKKKTKKSKKERSRSRGRR